MTTVLVTGATGNVGSSVIRSLAGTDVGVRAFVRDAAAARERLGEDVELAVGDLSDPGSVRRAMEGVDALFLSSADGPQKVPQETGAIDAAATAGVGLIVKASTVMAEAGSPLPPFDWNGRVEDHLRSSGVPFVILASRFYMTNLLMSADQVRAQGALFAPAGGGKVGMVDPRDTGAVGAAVLTSDGHDGRTYALTGPAVVTWDEVAEALGAATDRPIAYVDVPEEALRGGLTDAGMPDWLITHLVGLFGLIRQGAMDGVTDDVRTLTGREPRSVGEWARDHAGAFRG